MCGHAVVGEQGVQGGLSMHPCGAPMLKVQHGECDVAYPHHLRQPIRKSRLQREVFIPRVLSLGMSLEGTMVLNVEL